MIRRCSQCGFQADENSKYCAQCGNLIENTSDEEINQTPIVEQEIIEDNGVLLASNLENARITSKESTLKPLNKKLIAIVVILILGLVLAYYFFMIQLTNDDKQMVQDVMNKIDSIGIVNRFSENKITEAETMYNLLSFKLKRHIENDDKLFEARSEYDNIKANLVIEAINRIGEVSLSSQSTLLAMAQARKEFNSLTDEQKVKVENLLILTQAEKELSILRIKEVNDAIKNTLDNVDSMSAGELYISAMDKYGGLTEEQKKEVVDYAEFESGYIEFLIKKIENIGNVTLDSKESIEIARNLYKSCSDYVKSNINNYPLLEKAEKEFILLKINNVIDLINQIGTITLNSEEKINTAQSAYNELTSEEKQKVINRDTLNNASKTLKALETQNVISKLRSTTDKVTGVTWYYSTNHPYYIDIRSYILPYIGKSSSNTWLILKFNYTGDDWIFYDNVTIVIDGSKYYKTFAYGDIKRDNDYGEVWETADILPSTQDIEMLKKISNSNETIVRFEGDQHVYDFVVSSYDKNSIKDVLAAYSLLK